MFSIGELSKLAKTTVRTIRFYDEIGILKPSFVEENGYRYYSTADLETLTQIMEMRNVGLTLDDIKSVLHSHDLKTVLHNRSVAVQQQICHCTQCMELINKMLKKLNEGDNMNNNYKATKTDIPQYTVYYRHGVIATMNDLFPFILQAGAECGEHNPTLVCEDYCYVTYEANEYQERDVEVEYVEAVKEIGKESENIKFKTIPATKAISVEHHGSYATLNEAYTYAVNWVKANGYTISNKIREVYVHGCWDCDNESDYLTIIQVPIM